LMLAELALGRRGRGDAPSSIANVARASGASRRWAWVGIIGAATAFLILSFYAVIGGWAVTYAVKTLVDGLPAGAPAVEARFAAFLDSPGQMMLFHAAFLGAVAVVVQRGVSRGIEATMKVLMPVLAVLLVALAAYSMSTGDAGAAIRFLFEPDFGALDGKAILDALGLGFFSIGVGIGILLTYEAYSPEGVDLKHAAVAVVVGDTAISVLAGLAIFPIVFANNIDPSSGADLAFVSIPLAFDAMPGGRWAAIAFFLLLAIAALGSAVSMLEAVVAVLSTRRRWSRTAGTIAAAGACFVAGLATVFSFNHLSEVHPLGFVDRYAEATIFDLLDDMTSQLLLPVGGLALAVLVGWVLPDRFLGDELGLAGWPRRGLRLVLKVVAPVLIVAAAGASIASS
ncbi:MAG: sodium-dependent transporter, partial [Alphaproteobacteria bacterium]|nr:sodium-dependent transporter [Alphaproteobacteria bacterium]